MRRLKAVDLDVYMLFDKQTHAVTHQKMENSNDPSNYVSTCQNKVAHGMKLLMDASIFYAQEVWSEGNGRSLTLAATISALYVSKMCLWTASSSISR